MTTQKKVFVIMDNQEEKHDQPWPSYHIETPKRLEVISEKLKTCGLYDDPRVEHLPRREATEAEIRAVHTERYVDDVKSTETMTVEQQEEFCTKYEDIYVNSATWRRAKLAAASSIDLVSAVMTSRGRGIAFVRPPGHHAMPDEGCGFCIFNNVAIAAKAAIDREIARKVMIIDYDVHAGNGTQECVEEMGDACRLISIHRYEHGTFWPNMPQTGIYHNYKNTMNLPLNTTGLTDSDYLSLFTHIIIPSITSYQPDLLIVSSGFDASIGDPEGYMNVTPAGFATMIRMLTNTGIPVAAILEGGYFLEALAADAEWVLRALLDEKLPRIHMEPINPQIADTISRVIGHYQEKSAFFRKIQELRTILCQNIEENPENTDYYSERTVHPPYETRGMYTPFSAEKTNGFRRKLREIVESYEDLEGKRDKAAIIEVKNDVPQGLLGISDEKVVIGTGKAVKFFVETLFMAPIDSTTRIENFKGADLEFEDIVLDWSLVESKDLPLFKNLPIFNL